MADSQHKYLAALAQEGLVRDVACLSLGERVGDFRLRSLTLRDYAALRVMNSPFLPPRRKPNVFDLAGFLWLLAPTFQPGTGRRANQARKCFLRPLRGLLHPVPGWSLFRRQRGRELRRVRQMRRLMRAAFALVDESFQDAPPPTHVEGSVPAPQYYCDVVGICASLARAYGGGIMPYLDMPLKIVFQLLKENREHMYLSNGKTPVMYNRSDNVSGAELLELNRRLHREGVPMHPDALAFRERNL